MFKFSSELQSMQLHTFSRINECVDLYIQLFLLVISSSPISRKSLIPPRRMTCHMYIRGAVVEG